MPSVLWGSAGGKEVHLTTLRSEALEVDICSLGCALVAARVLVRGEWIDVLMGYESLERYTNNGKPNFGTVVGRCANRIAGAKFELDGQSYQLEANNGPNHLHGGVQGFWCQPFDLATETDTSVTLKYVSPDGDQGYPGQAVVSVTYEVVDSELHFRYEGTTDKPTVISLTNHAYWNLKGHQAGDALDHKLEVMASRTTAMDATSAMTGELLSVEGTGFDLRGVPHLLREVVDKAGPLDLNYCLDGAEGAGKGKEVHAAKLIGPNGLVMDVFTDAPGLQVYTGNFIGQADHPPTWWHGKGARWEKFGAVCLEPQLWPDGIHQSHFPSPVLRPGETYRQHSWHVFRVEDA